MFIGPELRLRRIFIDQGNDVMLAQFAFNLNENGRQKLSIRL